MNPTPTYISVILPVTGAPTIHDCNDKPFVPVTVEWRAFTHHGKVIVTATAFGDGTNTQIWNRFSADLPPWAPDAPGWFDAAVEDMRDVTAVSA